MSQRMTSSCVLIWRYRLRQSLCRGIASIFWLVVRLGKSRSSYFTFEMNLKPALAQPVDLKFAASHQRLQNYFEQHVQSPCDNKLCVVHGAELDGRLHVELRWLVTAQHGTLRDNASNTHESWNHCRSTMILRSCHCQIQASDVVCNSSTAFSTPDRHSDDVATDDAGAAGTIMIFLLTFFNVFYCTAAVTIKSVRF